ncbi:MAG: CNNM domain-containing protein [Halobacteriota archaeon]
MSDLAFAAVGGLSVVVLLLVSAFFSSSEIALFSLPDAWFDQQARSEDHRGVVLADLHADPHRLLVTLLVGNNVVNIAISSIVAVIVTGFLDPGSAVLVTTLLTSFLVLVFGEIVPKAYGLGNAERWSLVVAVPLRVVERVLSPLITFFDWITRGLNAIVTVDDDIEKPYVGP